ncbi:Eco57I restriction-modification methylase domain-containing protein [Candidatus Harpocratesius sp.]
MEIREWIQQLDTIRKKWINFQRINASKDKTLILKQNISKINLFFLRFVGFMILESAKYQKLYSQKKTINITSMLFVKQKQSNDDQLYLVNEEAFEKELSNMFHCEKNVLPEIFQFQKRESEVKKEKTILVNFDIVKDFQKLQKSSILYDIKEPSDIHQNNSNTTIKITPAFLDYFYQHIILNEEQDLAHSGTFFSPLAEVSYSILFSLVYYILNISDKFIKNKQITAEKWIIFLFQRVFQSKHDNEFIINQNEIMNFRKKILTNQIFNKEGLFLSNSFNVLDPSCGSGTFIIRFLQLINFIIPTINNFKDNHKILKNVQIFGCDLRLTALYITNFRIWCALFLIFGKNLNQIQEFINHSVHLIQADYLFEFNEKLPNKSIKFDLIIGNPPYIRHRDLRDMRSIPFLSPEQYRDKLNKKLIQFKNQFKIDFNNHMDYSLYFFLHSAELLSPYGVLSFITSNSWMNVKYGYQFQEFLLRFMKIWQIADNSARSFEFAEINTVISFFSKKVKNKEEKYLLPKFKIENSFIRWKKPFHSLNFKDFNKYLQLILSKQRNNQVIDGDQSSYLIDAYDDNSTSWSIIYPKDFSFRLLQISSRTMFNWTNERKGKKRIRQKINDNSYEGYQWGNYFFIAPKSFFIFRSLLGIKLAYLGDYGKITRGITTNCNDFFVLKKMSDNSYKNGYGDIIILEDQVLRPFLFSPRQVNIPLLNRKDLDTYLFYTNLSKVELQQQGFYHTLEYIEYAESKRITIKKGVNRGKIIQGINNLASFHKKYEKDPNSWYCLQPKNKKKQLNNFPTKSKIKFYQNIYIQKIFNDTFRIVLTKSDIIANNTFYRLELFPSYSQDRDLIIAILLSSLFPFSIELHGRTNFGGGALDTASFDIAKIMVLNIDLLNVSQKKELTKLSQNILNLKFLPVSQDIRRKEKIKLDQKILTILECSVQIQQFHQDLLKIIEMRIKKKKIK